MTRTTAPRTWSPALYRRWGSSARIWKSATLRFRLRSERGRLRRDRKLGRVEEVVDAVGEVARGAGEVDEPAESTGDEGATLGDLDAAVPGAEAGLASDGEDFDRRPIPRYDAEGMESRIRGRRRRRGWETDVAGLGSQAREVVLCCSCVSREGADSRTMRALDAELAGASSRFRL